MTHIFRNSTVELLFGNAGFTYSGYDEVTNANADADEYVSMHANTRETAEEIASYMDRLKLVHSQVPATKPFYAFTLFNLFDFRTEIIDFSVVHAINEFNSSLIQFAKEASNVKIIDFAAFCRLYPESELLDWKFYFISQTALNPKLALPFRKWFAAQ